MRFVVTVNHIFASVAYQINMMQKINKNMGQLLCGGEKVNMETPELRKRLNFTRCQPITVKYFESEYYTVMFTLR